MAFWRSLVTTVAAAVAIPVMVVAVSVGGTQTASADDVTVNWCVSAHYQGTVWRNWHRMRKYTIHNYCTSQQLAKVDISFAGDKCFLLKGGETQTFHIDVGSRVRKVTTGGNRC